MNGYLACEQPSGSFLYQIEAESKGWLAIGVVTYHFRVEDTSKSQKLRLMLFA